MHRIHKDMEGAPQMKYDHLVAMPGGASSFLFLVAMPGAVCS